MIAEIDGKNRVAELFAELANVVAGRVEARIVKRSSLFDHPLIAKLARRKA